MHIAADRGIYLCCSHAPDEGKRTALRACDILFPVIEWVVSIATTLYLETLSGVNWARTKCTLLGKDVAIRYDERHFLALRTLLEVADESRHHQLPVTGGEEQHAH